MIDQVLFSQQEVQDPYEIYHYRLQQEPVYFDAVNNLWAIHTYDDCKQLLQHPFALIPPVCMEGLNEAALLLAGRLVRLSNPPQHTRNREVAMQLYQQIRQERVDTLLCELLQETEIDWVKDVCQRLPALLLLKGLQFTKADSACLSNCLPRLVKLMLPVKTPDQITAINAIAPDVYELLADHLQRKEMVAREDIPATVSNLIGLLIQSYDAGSGLLANALLHFLRKGELPADKQYLQLSVQETLRFDPPIHHTRRLAADDIQTGEHIIRKGQGIVIVLAAANRDERQFAQPETYNIYRPNNHTHLTFGAGMHQCIAQRFSTGITTDALYYLFERYKHITLLQQDITYAPLVNARIPDSLLLSLR